MRYLRALGMFGPGLVLAAGALVLGRIPNHPERRAYCASMRFTSGEGDPDCPIKADHRPAEVALVAALAALALLIASCVAWRRYHGGLVPDSSRPYSVQRRKLSRISVRLFSVLTIVMALSSCAAAEGEIIVYPFGDYQDCGSPAFFERDEVTDSMNNGAHSGKATVDICEQIAWNGDFTAVGYAIVAALSAFPWGYALRQSRRQSARFAAMPDREPFPQPGSATDRLGRASGVV